MSTRMTGARAGDTPASISKSQLPADARLKISEVFHSIQGESLSAGLPTVFVRLTGCPLRCQYCDTAYAFHGGSWRSFDDLLAHIRSFETPHVCVTGGEPLAQRNCAGFMTRLCDAGFRVSVETSGAYDIARLDPRIVRVMDLKTPGSGEAHRNRMENLGHLRARDQVKFVICDRDDYKWALECVRKNNINQICTVLFSPSFEELAPDALAEWILADRAPVRLQLQLHKLLWGNAQGR